MSEKPKGAGFELPDDFIKGLDKFAAENEDHIKNREAEKMRELILKNNPVVEVDEIINIDIDEPTTWKRTKTEKPEDVSNRAGGSNQKRKASKALASAEMDDRDNPAFVKPDYVPENKKRTTKRTPKQNLKEVDFENEIKSRMPNPEDIEGQVFLTDEGQVLKNKEIEEESFVELPDLNSIEGKTFFNTPDISNLEEKVLDFSDPEIETKTLKTKDILSSTSIEELLQKIDESDGIQGSKEYFDKDKLKMIIGMVQEGELGFEYITRSGKLRQKVFDLLNQPEEKFAYLSEEEFVKPTENVVADNSSEEPEEKFAYLSEEEFIRPSEDVDTVDEVEEKLEVKEDVEIQSEPKQGKPKFIVDWNKEDYKKELDASTENLKQNRENFVEANNKFDKTFNKTGNPFVDFFRKIKRGSVDIEVERKKNLAARVAYEKSVDRQINALTNEKVIDLMYGDIDPDKIKTWEEIEVSELNPFIKDKLLSLESKSDKKEKYIQIVEKFRNIKDSDEDIVTFDDLIKMKLFTKTELSKIYEDLLKINVRKFAIKSVVDEENKKVGKN